MGGKAIRAVEHLQMKVLEHSCSSLYGTYAFISSGKCLAAEWLGHMQDLGLIF